MASSELRLGARRLNGAKIELERHADTDQVTVLLMLFNSIRPDNINSRSSPAKFQTERFAHVHVPFARARCAWDTQQKEVDLHFNNFHGTSCILCF